MPGRHGDKVIIQIQIIFFFRINFLGILSRFEEECTTVEEEDCKTVYDEVWEKKCEMVNVTVPQTECQEVTETIFENK